MLPKTAALVRALETEVLEAGWRLVYLRDRRAWGECDTATRTVTVARGGRRWVWTLAHEVCHLRQERLGLFRKTSMWDIWSTWLRAPTLPPAPSVARACAYIRRCELDAEKRAYALLDASGIERWDPEEFVREASRYVLGYDVALATGRWPSRTSMRALPIGDGWPRRVGY